LFARLGAKNVGGIIRFVRAGGRNAGLWVALLGASVATLAARPTSVSPAPDLGELLRQTTNYVEAYLRQFTDVVAGEDYAQRFVHRGHTRQQVRLRSDLLLLRTADVEGWVAFRDVFEVNGRRVHDRRDRLSQLFAEKQDARAEARAISEESARYNVGPVFRTVNIPLQALHFLQRVHLAAFRFQLGDEEEIGAIRATRVDYTEVGRPTVIRDRRGHDRPARGSLWIDGKSGRILKTTLRVGDAGFDLLATVTYRLDRKLGIWVPDTMEETYRDTAGAWVIYCEAKYANFRRFQVETEEVYSRPGGSGH
jgi:hypothetical protein